MRFQVIMAAISLIKELLRFLAKHRKCDCPESQARHLEHIAHQAKIATDSDEDINIII